MEKKKSRYMKRPNGSGSVRKLSGRRSKPWSALVTIGYEDDGKQIQKAIGYFAKREEALAALTDYYKNPYDIGINPTFADIYEKIDITHLSRYSLNSYRTAYSRCEPIHNVPVREIKRTQLQNVADSLADYSKATQQEVRILWNVIFNHAMQEDIILKDYSKFVKWNSTATPRDKLAFTESQVNSFNDDLLILSLTGMRIGEYLNLKTSDIKDGFIHLNGTKTASAVRIIPIHQKLAEIVNLRLTGAYLCEGSHGKMSYTYFYNKIFKPEMDRLGIDGHTPHDTRRTFATLASRSGMDKEIVKRILGHSLNDLTERVYTIKDKEDLRKEMEKLVI